MIAPIVLPDYAALHGCVPLVGSRMDVAIAEIARDRLAGDLLRKVEAIPMLSRLYGDLLRECTSPTLWLYVDHDDLDDAYKALLQIGEAHFRSLKATRH